MTPRIAFALALFILCLLVADLAYGWGAGLFVMRKLDGLVRWMAFWR